MGRYSVLSDVQPTSWLNLLTRYSTRFTDASCACVACSSLNIRKGYAHALSDFRLSVYVPRHFSA